MATITLKKIYEDLLDLKGEMQFIRHVIEEEYELSDWAKNELRKARTELKSKYISQKEIEEEFLQ